MADLSQLLGNNPLAGLLSTEQRQQAEQQAQNAGLLNLALGMIAGSRGAPGQGKPSLIQSAVPALQAGIQGYQGSFDKTLKDLLTNMQVKDMMAKREREKQLQALLPQVFKTTRAPATEIPTELGATGDLGTYTPVMEPGRVTGVQLDPQKLQALMMVPGGIEAVKGLADTQKLLRQSGLGVGGGEMISPFAPYLQSESPQVKTLAQQYDKAYKSGTITEEDAYKRIEPLGKMESQFLERSAAKQSAKDAREQKAAEGTEGQVKASGFANQMVNADTIISNLEGSKGSDIVPGRFKSFVGAIPLIGESSQKELMSSDQLKYKNAADAWVRAKLRFESGAAIGEKEMEDEYKTFFPIAQDDEKTIQQKSELRKIATQNMLKAAGKAYKPSVLGMGLNDIKNKYGLE